MLGVYLGCVMCKNASSLHSPHWCLALCYFKQHHLVPLMTGLRKKPCIIWCQNWVCLEIRWISCWLDVDFQYFDCCLVVYYAFKTSAKYEWIFINIPSCIYIYKYRSSPHVHIPFQHSNLKMYLGSFEVPAFIYAGWPAWSPTYTADILRSDPTLTTWVYRNTEITGCNKKHMDPRSFQIPISSWSLSNRNSANFHPVSPWYNTVTPLFCCCWSATYFWMLCSKSFGFC